MTLKKNKVVLGLSGGVDSTAAALLLQEKGYEVVGLYFDIEPAGQESEDRFRQQGEPSGRERAETAAEQLGIRFVYRNVSREFSDTVIRNFCSEYASGRTPNPCIVCNPTVKFKTLLSAADELGAYYIATGHYAGTCYHREMETWYIRRAASRKKDQSYMLYRLGQEAIARLLLPLNDMQDKEQVRSLARKKALKNADARDSQEICFIKEGDHYRDFLMRQGITAPKGEFVDSDGTVLGEHQGILRYTVGQRKGLGIALGRPVFVTAIDSEKNQVVLGDEEELFCREVISDGNILCGICLDPLPEAAEARSIGLIGINEGLEAKIRYAADAAAAEIEVLQDGRIKTTFQKPQRAATPGQSIVFYQDDLVIGGGFILSTT